MSQDFPNTVLMWEPTRNEGSQFDDIFDPDVRVLLSWRDVEAAVEVGAVVPSEAYALWAYWAAPSSPARLAAKAVLQPKPDTAAKPEQLAAMVSGAAPAGAPLSSSLLDVQFEPLEMKLPGQRKPQQGMPAWIRILLAVVVAAMMVWALGKGLNLWSK
jgi:hypothetical protein